MISIILPTYERADAVLCCLAALENQTNREFETILIDDSETDAVFRALIDPDTYKWTGVDRYIRSAPPRAGSFTAARARNIGAANASGDLLVFIDQDVMLAPDALERYAEAYERYGDNVVYVGLYHWLPRMDFGPEDVRERFQDIEISGFWHLQPYTYTGGWEPFDDLPMDEPGILGRDMREKDFGGIDHLVDDAALGAFSGNIGYPRKLYLELGGMDEWIRGHGGEDADLGLTAKEHGAKFLLWDAIWGLHRWHTRNQAQNAREVQANIAYIDKKHGVGQYAEAKKWCDARDWMADEHYTKEAGAVAMQGEGDNTIWACRDGHRKGFATAEAFKGAGFLPGDVLKVPLQSLDQYEVMGVLG